MPSKTTKTAAKSTTALKPNCKSTSDEDCSPPNVQEAVRAASALVKKLGFKSAMSAARSKRLTDQNSPIAKPAKVTAYPALVAARKACNKCSASGLTNPASIALQRLDSDQIGPWTRWNGDLDARLLVIGQEWGDIASFVRQNGIDTPSPTNDMLRELLEFAGLPVAPAPTSISKSGVFLTNAALCLKVGGAQAAVNKEWFQNCGLAFLRAQVELVQPSVVVSLGERAYRALCHAFALPRCSFRKAANCRQPIRLPTGAMLVPVYHCGKRILNTHRKRSQQFEDWALVKALLAVNHA